MSPFTRTARLIQTTLGLDVRCYDPTGQLSLSLNNPVVTAPHQPQLPDLTHIDQLTHYTDPWQLSYLLVPLPTGTCVVGPFTTTTLTSQVITTVLAQNHLTVSEQHQLTQLYDALPMLSPAEVTATGTVVVNLWRQPPLTPTCQTLTANPQNTSPAPLPKLGSPDTTAIDHHYQVEAALMATVRAGNTVKIVDYFRPMTAMLTLFQNRLPNQPLRSCKNMCLVSNTLNRIAARQGGVHPVYLDSISEKYALLVERQRTITGLKQLTVAMLTDYTQLVKDHATTGYSPLIKRTVDYVTLHLGHPLRVTSIATALNASSTYLSRRFKAETGQTLTRFIHTQRIQSAQTYLLNTTTSITTIALLVGFPDLASFTKQFKRLTGQTPRDYRQHPRFENAR
ncbi:helix-turn-helix domain-containing protein [Levilactobacillus acidifarinae]|uniref:HTH araC/xylS-type domain-containing protein n=1 Tax=Levilactobacillus acidifarinae DSM 19394 = JCM 15949 TaxID=1423715 RepID=A0A0R1LVL3_9LACO|nr:AraC family transcriptional regulator [Levilactobacillus acidifarinae]KRK96458.1 hypothetical protein FD25_GL001954 [Levilactobacillus acidifarinae DSM 19394]GEO68956.1 hypothetical protein LAC03_08660 [Levilactobacillus acidifarinae]